MKLDTIKNVYTLAQQLKLPWKFYWNRHRKIIEIAIITKELGWVLLAKSNKLKKKPDFIQETIEEIVQSENRYCTAHRDEKKKSLPRHTAQLSRNMQSGDTNSATAYRSNTKRMGVSDRRGRKKGKTKNKSRKGGKSCASA